MTEIKVPIKVRPIPLGEAEEHLLKIEKGTKIRSVIPDDFDGLILFNYHILNESQNPEITEIDDIEFLIPLKGGGGGKDTLRSVAMLTVAAIATVATGGIAHPFLHAAAAISINVAGSLLINELIPPQMPGGVQDESDKITGFSTKSLSGSRNKPASYSVFPKLYGQRRIKPYYAASPYTEIVGNDQYINLLFFLNFGPVTIKNKNGVEELLGYHYNNGYQDSVLDIDSDDNDSQISFASETVKIDETSLNELDEWQCIIGSANKIQESTNFRDVEIEYPNISFESGFAYQLEPFSLDVKGDWHGTIRYQKGLHLIQEKVIDIPDTTNSDLFEFEISDTSSSGGTLFKLEVMYKEQNYFKSVYPGEDSILNSGIKDTLGVNNFWATKSNKTRSSGYIRLSDPIKKIRISKYCRVTSTQDISGRTQYWYTPFQSSLQFKSFKFYTSEFAVYTTAPNTYAISIDITAANGLYYVDSKNKRKKLTLEYDVYYKLTTDTMWLPVQPNRNIGPEADIKSKILKIEGNSAQTYRAGLYWEVGSGPNSYDVKIVPKNKTTYDGYAQESVTWETLKSYQSKNNSVWAPFVDDLTVPEDYPDYINIRKKCTLMYLRLKASPTLQGNTNNISILCGGSVRDISVIDIDNNITYEDCNHSIDKNVYASPGNIYADTLLNGSVVEYIAQNKINWDSLKDFVDFCKTYNLTYNNYEVSEETILQRLNRVCSVGLGKFGLNNEQFGIIRDVPNQPSVQVITPLNTNSFEANKEFNKTVHAVKVQYTNENTWETDYVIVYNTGYNLDGSDGKTAASEFVTLDPDGITNVEQAKIYGRYHLATITLRPERYSVNMDIENLRLEIGDCCYIAYDTIKVGEIYSRVKTINKDGSGNVISIITPELVTDIQPGKGICFRHDNGLSFDITYPVDENLTTEFEIFLETPQQISDLNPDDIFVYGDINSEKLKAKVTEIRPGNNFTADIKLVNAAEEIHETYTTGNIPSYTPVIDGRAETGLNKPPTPKIISVESGNDFVTTSEALNEPFNLKVVFEVPYTLVGIDEIIVEYKAQAVTDAVFEADVFEPGVFAVTKKDFSGKKIINYDGSQTYILVEAEPYTDYEIKIYSNKEKDGILRVSQPDIYNYSTPQDINIPEVNNLEYQKEANKSIILSWSDPNLNYPVIYQIYVFDQDENDFFLIAATDNVEFDTGKRFIEAKYAISIVDITRGNIGPYKEIEINEPIPLLSEIKGRTLDSKIELSWERTNPEIIEYEIREGLLWEEGTELFKTSGTSVLIDKTTPQIYNFMIRGNLPDLNYTDISNIAYNFPYGKVGDPPGQKPGLDWKEDITAYVGDGGNFDTFNQALEYFSGLITGYKANPIEVKLFIYDDYVITEQIVIENFDFSFIKLLRYPRDSQAGKQPIQISISNSIDSVGFCKYSPSADPIQCKPIFKLVNAKAPLFSDMDFYIPDSINNNGTSIFYLNNSELDFELDLNCMYEKYGNFCFFATNNSIIKHSSSIPADSFQADNFSGLFLYANKSTIFLDELLTISYSKSLDPEAISSGFTIVENKSLCNLPDVICDDINFWGDTRDNSTTKVKDITANDSVYINSLPHFFSAYENSSLTVSGDCNIFVTGLEDTYIYTYAGKSSSISILFGTLYGDNNSILYAIANSDLEINQTYDDPLYSFIISENSYSTITT